MNSKISGQQDWIQNKINILDKTHNFAIFPDDQSGHESLLETLNTTYGESSIHQMIYSYAPPKENPTKKYERFLREKTGIFDNTPIKKFSTDQFEELWKANQAI